MKTMDQKEKPLVGFFPLFYNLSESGRAVLVAERFTELGGKAIFFSHGGEYEYLAKDLGFEIIRVKPFFTKEILARYQKVVRGEKNQQLYPKGFIDEAIKNEIAIFKETGIQMIVSTHNYFSVISARAAKLPLIGITTAPGSFHHLIPDFAENIFTRLLPQYIKIRFAKLLLEKPLFYLKPFNSAAKRYNVKKIGSHHDLLYGDITLATNFLEFIDIFPNQQEFPSEDYIGIIVLEELFEKNFSDKNTQLINREIMDHIKGSEKSILLSMGSSGEKNLYLKILQTLNKTNYKVIAVLTNILDEAEIPKLNDNILFKKYVPSIRKLHSMVDLSIIHGGQGTVYTAAYAGKPIIGFPMQFEQHLNLEKMVGHGAGLMLSKKYFDEQKLLDTLNTIFDNYDQFLSDSQALAQKLPKPEGDKNAAKRIMEILKNIDKSNQ
ncbi:MAG: hypothetical protein KAW45_03905 [Thermoplasmatales archaeon]|nr:hypothetical protein [Thermoplasmatales archaeon]